MPFRPSDIWNMDDSEFQSHMRQLFLAVFKANNVEFLSRVGFNESRLREGEQLFREYDELLMKQASLHAEKYGLRVKRDDRIIEAHERIGITRNILKTTLDPDDGLRETLGLHERRARPKAVASWIKQHDRFYRNMTSEVVQHLKEYGYDRDRIREEKSLVESVIELEERRVDTLGAAMRATIQRDAAREELHQWLSRFFKLARIAYREKPQLIEGLGVLERS